MARHWTIVIPLKRLSMGKSRLDGVDGVRRERLALAFAADAVAVAARCPRVDRVIVVSEDRVDLPGAEVVPDTGGAGLNAAIRQGAAIAPPGTAVAALAGDLPALDDESLAHALASAEAHPRSFVTDAAGVGTTMLLAAPGVDLHPQFGPRSRAAHAASGAVEIAGDPIVMRRLRRDVDTDVDLWDAIRIGVGPATREALS